MSLRDTLPAAVDYEDCQALAALDDVYLLLLTNECEGWWLWMDGLRAGLTTSVGMTEWGVQMRGEIHDVDAAHGRLRDEIEARRCKSAGGWTAH